MPLKAPLLTKKRRNRLSAWERADLALERALEPALRTRAVTAVGRLGNAADEPPLLGLSAGVLLAGVVAGDARLRRAGVRMLLAHGAATALKTFGKDRVDRSRPDAFLDENRYAMRRGRSQAAEWRAFPSGHTAGAVAVSRAFAREFPTHSLAGAGFAAALGALQVARRAHFAGDVVAGALLGLLAEGAAGRLVPARAP